MNDCFMIYPVGRIRKQDNRTWIDIAPSYKEAMSGLEGFSHINVLYWFHENDTREGRCVFKVHPRKDTKNPLTGVFATHSPNRPNLLGLSLCKILSINNTVIEIDTIDARDNSPVIDIKCYIPDDRLKDNTHVPDWV